MAAVVGPLTPPELGALLASGEGGKMTPALARVLGGPVFLDESFLAAGRTMLVMHLAESSDSDTALDAMRQFSDILDSASPLRSGVRITAGVDPYESIICFGHGEIQAILCRNGAAFVTATQDPTSTLSDALARAIKHDARFLVVEKWDLRSSEILLYRDGQLLTWDERTQGWRFEGTRDLQSLVGGIVQKIAGG